MSSEVCFLITLLYGDTLLKCALKVNRDNLTGDVEDYPMEPENRKQLHELLPLHVRSCGPIVGIERLFDVVVSKE